MINNIHIGKNITIGETTPLTLIAGPCAIESMKQLRLLVREYGKESKTSS